MAATLASSGAITSYRTNCRCTESITFPMWGFRGVCSRCRRGRRRGGHWQEQTQIAVIDQQGRFAFCNTKVGSCLESNIQAHHHAASQDAYGPTISTSKEYDTPSFRLRMLLHYKKHAVRRRSGQNRRRNPMMAWTKSLLAGVAKRRVAKGRKKLLKEEREDLGSTRNQMMKVYISLEKKIHLIATIHERECYQSLNLKICS